MQILGVADPEPGEGEVIIKVARCGVCGTDLHFTSGHGYTFDAGTIMGHEYAGEIIALGKGVDALAVGDHIAGMPVIGCGHCDNCKTGIDVLCTTYSSYAEGMAQFARVSARGATLLPKTLSLADGALVEPLAVGRRGVRLAAPAPGTKALVIGPGPIGLASIFWLWQAGVRKIAVLASSTRRQALAEKMGASRYILEGDQAGEEIVRALGGTPDLVIESAGVPGVLGRAVELVRPQGTIIALGLCATPETFSSGVALMKDITLRFSTTYTREDFEACADALARDGDRATAMVTDRVSLDDFPQAFEDFRAGKIVGKLVVDPWA
ncbi:alcohol dehydrogenase catalytic domain-containing protein [Novosphingobium sp. G106]|uniref:zinc-dependent alcohol dehydrogenase n=1 Tax=Novosphingobium sp. G106 TaxID=2849500 RepID=UPI001C2D4C22|nr:alcohol dehydrogenase catalytic domain-containing protein [Novosphingobium sp. G106]MBV1688882.1 alcohol dehydrogenase catalytic domain-containing protein [Novosphingobium sp. G106]